MRRYLRVRIGIVLAVIVGSLIYLYPPPGIRERLYGPTFAPMKKGGLLPPTLNLGLDLQGGIHLVLGVDVEKALESQVERAAADIRASLEKKGVGVTQVARQGVTEIALQLASPQTWNDALTVLNEFPVYDRRGIDQASGRILLALREREAATLRDLAIRQGLETIRNRVDQFGVAEPTIQQQGENRILVQLPGIQDPERAKALIGKTALLEFKFLDENVMNDPAALEKAVREGPPEGDEALWQKIVDKETRQERRIPYIVKKKTLLTGADLTTARVSIDQTTSEPYVSVEFNKPGARVFGELTEQNVGKRLAIILDGNVHSAPVIRERIPSGQAQITGGFTADQATDLAIVLRAGALPAPVKILEERSVGPSLGADSIRQGMMAILASVVVVFLFMLAYYRLSGLVANVALGLNLVILLAVMAGFHATLTLPGIAGIALTIGMAVDTNILIFERIREEFRTGKTIRAAIDAGFTRAFRTVVDTHITVLVSAAILYNFGTGPVRGFAVSLWIGIAASLFTAVFFTRLVFDLLYMGRRRLQALSI
ncbi:MAG: protein translocase subunit SecD [Candidatus Rokubacteria bacterium]|nr:protein translocase subunit SecD [Candidatus Rokubacteria bacterium]MBI2555215.1 protein translocase subunit SecD [Candidatus Rokubacteria bacterium]